MSYSKLEQGILNDKKSGSSEILISALRYNVNYLEKNWKRKNSLIHLIQFNNRVIDEFPGMAIVGNGLDRINRLLSDADQMDRSLSSITRKIRKVGNEVNGADKKILKNCSGIFRNKIAVASFSNSGLIKKVVKQYRHKIKKIFLSESRPSCEGMEMAKFSSATGVKVIYMVDVLLPAMLSEADILLLGADSVGRHSFVNKIGSGILLKAARAKRIKSAVLFEFLKVGPIDSKSIGKENLNPDEIWADRNDKNIEIRNRYFEVVPNKHADLFISDRGIDTAASLKTRITEDSGGE